MNYERARQSKQAALSARRGVKNNPYVLRHGDDAQSAHSITNILYIINNLMPYISNYGDRLACCCFERAVRCLLLCDLARGSTVLFIYSAALYTNDMCLRTPCALLHYYATGDRRKHTTTDARDYALSCASAQRFSEHTVRMCAYVCVCAYVIHTIYKLYINALCTTTVFFSSAHSFGREHPTGAVCLKQSTVCVP